MNFNLVSVFNSAPPHKRAVLIYGLFLKNPYRDAFLNLHALFRGHHPTKFHSLIDYSLSWHEAGENGVQSWSSMDSCVTNRGSTHIIDVSNDKINSIICNSRAAERFIATCHYLEALHPAIRDLFVQHYDPSFGVESAVPHDTRTAALRTFSYSTAPGGKSYRWWGEVGNHPDLFTKEAYRHPKLREFIDNKLAYSDWTCKEFGMHLNELAALLRDSISDSATLPSRETVVITTSVTSPPSYNDVPLATKFVSGTLTKKKATPKLRLG